MKKYLQVQSISDIITNSSSEVFIVSKEDFLYYIEKYDGHDNECFLEVKKLTRKALGMEQYYRYSFKSPDEVLWRQTLSILRIPENRAIKDGLLIEPKTFCNQTFYYPIYDWEASDEERRKMMDKFYNSWIKFVKKHEKEIIEKVVGTYWINVEDHFNEWADFREEIGNKGYLYRESRH